jgi:hypothetical protein
MEENRMKQAAASTVNALQQEASGQGGEVGTAGTVDMASVDAILGGWPETPQKVARKTIDKYGPPNEATPSRLIWFNNGPWKRTIIYRDEVPHNFPKPHTDLLEQFIDYQIPIDKYDDLAAYDGSVVPERTKGEISARCDMEEMNFLALNLAHDIITGARSVEDARQSYADTAVAFMMNRPAPYTEGLRFQPPAGETADTDETMIAGAMLKQTAGKVGDVLAGDGD